MHKPIKLAVVGLGDVAKKHIQAILRFPNDFQLVAIVDSQRDKLENYANTLSIKGFSTLEEVLKSSDVDIVILCTPSGLHARQAMVCAEHSKHVVVEKPIALSWEDGLAMQQAANKANVKLWVVHQLRANPALQLLKQTIDAQRFGKIFQVNINVFWTRPQAYYDAASWRGSRLLDGGALMNQASHYVDLLHWLFGPVQAIQAMQATQARQIETEDSCVLNIRWKQGTLGAINLSTLAYSKNLETSITVLGEYGTAKLAGLASHEIIHWEFADLKAKEDTTILQEVNKQAAQFLKNSHYYYYANLIAVLGKHAKPLADAIEGLRTLEILVAATRAAESQITVNLPLHGIFNIHQ